MTATEAKEGQNREKKKELREKWMNRLISNFGAANPLSGADVILDVARQLRLTLKVAVVTGDDVLEKIDHDQPALESGRPLSAHGPLISANASGFSSTRPSGCWIVSELSGNRSDLPAFISFSVHSLSERLAVEEAR